MPDGRDAWDKACGKGRRAPMLSGIFILPQTPHVHQLGSSPNFVCFLWSRLSHSTTEIAYGSVVGEPIQQTYGKIYRIILLQITQ